MHRRLLQAAVSQQAGHCQSAAVLTAGFLAAAAKQVKRHLSVPGSNSLGRLARSAGGSSITIAGQLKLAEAH